VSQDVLLALKSRLEDDVDGLAPTGDVLAAVTDCRYGELELRIEHEEEAESLRILVSLPPPAGAGRDFLVWCLSINTQYWDAKLGLDDEGHLVVHADVDVEEDPDEMASRVLDRVETIFELVDGDLVEWLLEHELGTPAQRRRWRERPALDEPTET
jgi:hypothetical protein